LLLIWTPPPLIVTCEIAALAAARPVLRAGNYAAYAVVMTPLIVLLPDFGQTISVAILADRLMAAIAGCLITLLFGYLPGPGSTLRRGSLPNRER
jgi:fusaric acid resistance family protein